MFGSKHTIVLVRKAIQWSFLLPFRFAVTHIQWLISWTITRQHSKWLWRIGHPRQHLQRRVTAWLYLQSDSSCTSCGPAPIGCASTVTIANMSLQLSTNSLLKKNTKSKPMGKTKKCCSWQVVEASSTVPSVRHMLTHTRNGTNHHTPSPFPEGFNLMYIQQMQNLRTQCTAHCDVHYARGASDSHEARVTRPWLYCAYYVWISRNVQ